MPKRTMWTAVGYSAGIATSLYVQRRVKRAVQRVAPTEVRHAVGARSGEVVERAKQLGSDLLAAAVEGRRAMQLEQQRLEHEFALPADAQPALGDPVDDPAPGSRHRARARRFSPR